MTDPLIRIAKSASSAVRCAYCTESVELQNIRHGMLDRLSGAAQPICNECVKEQLAIDIFEISPPFMGTRTGDFQYGLVRIPRVKEGELSFNAPLPRDLQHEYLVYEGNLLVVYRGQICSAHREGAEEIRGGGSIEKIVRTTISRKLPRIQLYPPRVYLAHYSRVRDRQLWKFSTEYNNHYILANGQDIHALPSHRLRGGLFTQAANAGIHLTSILFDNVFGPMEKQLLQAYELAQHPTTSH